jgi:prepilin-type N-terminal cleavage/methylation domain-containing protein
MEGQSLGTTIALFVLAAMYPPFKSRTILREKASTSAFTLVEVMVAVCLLGLLAAGSIWALSQANNYATVERLNTGAESVAQNQIDKLMTESPFNPQDSATPVDWTIGTTSPAVPPIIYSESSAIDPHTITGQMTTTVVKYVTPLISGTDLNIYTAVVTVTFTYRGKQYQVQLNAMRASDV